MMPGEDAILFAEELKRSCWAAYWPVRADGDGCKSILDSGCAADTGRKEDAGFQLVLSRKVG